MQDDGQDADDARRGEQQSRGGVAQPLLARGEGKTAGAEPVAEIPDDRPDTERPGPGREDRHEAHPAERSPARVQQPLLGPQHERGDRERRDDSDGDPRPRRRAVSGPLPVRHAVHAPRRTRRPRTPVQCHPGTCRTRRPRASPPRGGWLPRAGQGQGGPAGAARDGGTPPSACSP